MMVRKETSATIQRCDKRKSFDEVVNLRDLLPDRSHEVGALLANWDGVPEVFQDETDMTSVLRSQANNSSSLMQNFKWKVPALRERSRSNRAHRSRSMDFSQPYNSDGRYKGAYSCGARSPASTTPCAQASAGGILQKLSGALHSVGKAKKDGVSTKDAEDMTVHEMAAQIVKDDDSFRKLQRDLRAAAKAKTNMSIMVHLPDIARERVRDLQVRCKSLDNKTQPETSGSGNSVQEVHGMSRATKGTSRHLSLDMTAFSLPSPNNSRAARTTQNIVEHEFKNESSPKQPMSKPWFSRFKELSQAIGDQDNNNDNDFPDEYHVTYSCGEDAAALLSSSNVPKKANDPTRVAPTTLSTTEEQRRYLQQLSQLQENNAPPTRRPFERESDAATSVTLVMDPPKMAPSKAPTKDEQQLYLRKLAELQTKNSFQEVHVPCDRAKEKETWTVVPRRRRRTLWN